MIEKEMRLRDNKLIYLKHGPRDDLVAGGGGERSVVAVEGVSLHGQEVDQWERFGLHFCPIFGISHG